MLLSDIALFLNLFTGSVVSPKKEDKASFEDNMHDEKGHMYCSTKKMTKGSFECNKNQGKRKKKLPLIRTEKNANHTFMLKKGSKSATACEKRKLTLEHRRKYPVSNGEILKFFSQKRTSLYLENICKGEIQSERHNIVCNMFRSGKLDFGIHSKIFHLAQVQFLEDDQKIDHQLFEKMNRVLKKVNLSQIPGMSAHMNDSYDSLSNQYRQKYIYHVLVPEGIVKYLQHKNGWDKPIAENYFLDGESRVSNLELKEFDEELDEDARREKERICKEQYDTTDEEEDEVFTDDENYVDLELPNLEEPPKETVSSLKRHPAFGLSEQNLFEQKEICPKENNKAKAKGKG